MDSQLRLEPRTNCSWEAEEGILQDLDVELAQHCDKGITKIQLYAKYKIKYE